MANEQNLKKGNRFSKDNQPQRRGREKQFRTLLLDALRKVKVKEKTGRKIDVEDEETGEIRQEDELVEVALTEDMYIQRAIQMSLYDPAMMRDILSRLVPYVKPTAPIYEFELKSDKASDKILEVTQAVADGILPFDAAEVIVKMIRHGAEVQELSDLIARIESLEALLNDQKK
ncbi:hypothetical protein ABR33_06120 [Enterobacter bugandensis]|nr:hypothetical protein ABR33_06120 [Enterobacter bugandensis]